MHDLPYLLLVEDNQDDIDLTLRLLERHTDIRTVEVVTDGAQALEFLRRRSDDGERMPRLVLLDVNLPKVSGHDVLRHLRTESATQLTPVVMLSTSSNPVDISRSYESGANSYLTKPVSLTDFADAVRQLAEYWWKLNHGPDMLGVVA